MTLGAGDKKKVAILCGLGAVAAYFLYTNVLSGPASGPAAAPRAARETPAEPLIPPADAPAGLRSGLRRGAPRAGTATISTPCCIRRARKTASIP